MTVTGVTELSGRRVRIELEHQFTFVLYKGELRLYDIQEGSELSAAHYQKIMEEVLPKRAKSRAMNLLKSRSYTEKQLLQKLLLGGYPEETVKEAVAYVKSFGYIDDWQYALDFIEYNKEEKSKKRIQQDLMKKGISQELFLKAWESTVEDPEKAEKEQILRWLDKKKFDAGSASYEDIQKMSASLYRKGFSINNIRSVLSLDITSI